MSASLLYMSRDVALLMLVQGFNVWLHVQAYDDEILATLQEAVLAPLAGHIEGDLRIHLHASQHLGAYLDPTDRSLRSVAPLLRLQVLRLPTRALSIRSSPISCLVTCALTPACAAKTPSLKFGTE